MSTMTTAGPLPEERLARGHASPEPIPSGRILRVELAKMFDTRSGFWLMTSVVIAAVLATVATVLWAPRDDLSYGSFAGAIGVPMTIILPMIAILGVTSEWSQRTGLTSFTLVPHRGRVIAAKLVGTVLVGVVSILVAFAVGAVGNVVGSAIAGVDTSWDISFGDALLILLADGLGMLMGFMLGVLIRNSAGAIVGYFVYALVLQAIFEPLAAAQDWFHDIRGWVDFNFDVNQLYDGGLSATDWAHLGVAGTFWLLVPLLVGLRLVLRTEVK
jgi:hypothetical protein